MVIDVGSTEKQVSTFWQNSDNVIGALEKYIYKLIQFKVIMANDDFEAVFEDIKNTNHIKQILIGIEFN